MNLKSAYEGYLKDIKRDSHIEDFTNLLWQKQLNTAKACLHKKLEELTEEEKFCLCVVAGCPTEIIQTLDKNYKQRTVNPVGIIKIAGKFQVYERQN